MHSSTRPSCRLASLALCAAAAISVLAQGLSGPASAGSRCGGSVSSDCEATDAPAPPAEAAPAPQGIAISGLLGSVALGNDRQRIGTVHDVLVGEDGRVVAVTLDVGAFLGVPTRTVAVPAGKLRLVPAASAPLMPPAAQPTSISSDDADATDSADDAETSGLLEDLMTGSARTPWQAGPADHIEIALTRRELADLPSYPGD